MSAIAFTLGALAWNGSEYCIHRFVGHGPKRRPPTSGWARLTPAGLAYEFNREHLAHHTNPSYFAPTRRKVMAAASAIPALGALLSPFVGVRRAASFALGFGVAYGAYEVVHRFIHTRPPRGPYARWVRRHHLLHHHKTPRENHGVTSPFWDHVVGTYEPLVKVRIPRHVAPPWLVDAEGRLRPEHAADYELVPSASRAPRGTPRPADLPGFSGPPVT